MPQEDYQYDFYNRDSELEQLRSGFKDVIDNKKSKSFIIQGKKNIGKTRLVQEFVNRIDSDLLLKADIPKYSKNNSLIEYECEINSDKPYTAFVEITKEIYGREKIFSRIIKFIKIGLAIFGINDLLNAFEDFVKTFKEDDEKRNIIHTKELKIFNQYRNFLKRRSSKTPLIIIIRNMQWMDVYSLKLINALLSGKDSFWGLIILEYDDLEIREDVANELNNLFKLSNVSQIHLFSLDKSFPNKLLSSRFRRSENFFSHEENDMLYTISEGSPGDLIRYIENQCITNNLIYKENNVWVKKKSFLDKIKPDNQRLLELIISLYEDEELSNGDIRLIEEMSGRWGVEADTVTSTINMVRDIMNEGYKIGQTLGVGIFSKNSFLSFKNNSRFIIEYVQTSKDIPLDKKVKREIDNQYLLEATEIKISSTGILIIWDYHEGKRSRDVLLKAFNKHLKYNLSKFKQLAEGLTELHKNGMVHGFIKPEAVIETKEGEFKLASFDTWFIKYIEDYSSKSDVWETTQYIAPELLKSKEKEPTAKSDIYSLGILMYKSLTNSFPFHGRTKSELIESIENDKLKLYGQYSEIIPSTILAFLTKSTSFNPIHRYSDAEEFKQELVKIEQEWNDNEVVPPSPPPIPPPPPPKLWYKKYVRTAAAIVILIIISYIGWNYIIDPPPPPSIENEIVYSIKSISKTKNNDNKIKPKTVDFLIQDGIQRAGSKPLLNEEQFNSLFPSNTPVKNIEISIIDRDHNHELIIQITNNKTSNKESIEIPFIDKSELLNLQFNNIINLVLEKQTNLDPVTYNWDAFKSFIQGEDSWSKLDKTRAKIFYEKSLSIDPQFVLPKLKLAKIYHFEGNNKKALEQINDVKGTIDQLSPMDSIKTMALGNILNGKQREAIKNYRDLLYYMPMHKEPYFELAEAYFNIREIDDAMSNYFRALDIDPNFSLAINHYAYCFSHVGNHKKALELFRKYVSLDSSANSFDSFGDGFFSAGLYDSARYYKQMGLKLDPDLDYLYNSLSYINIFTGKIKDALDNINDYLELQDTPEMISNGYTIKALIYYNIKDYSNALDNCLKAISIYDSNNLISRNHELHWLLAKIHFKMGNLNEAKLKMGTMKNIIAEYNIDENNYNEIFKFYNELLFTEYCNNDKKQEMEEILYLFDNQIGNKIKDWSSPYDPAFFNTEFGITLLNNGYLKEAETRFKKALEFNENYPKANYFLAEILKNKNDTINSKKYSEKFKKITIDADNIYMNSFQN